jgi:hypothetical protein
MPDLAVTTPEAPSLPTPQEFLRSLPAPLLRQWIVDLEAFLDTVPGKRLGNAFPLRHSFGEQIYMREMYIPAGYIVTGRIHKYMNPNFLMSGEALIITEQHGVQQLVGPVAMMAMPGEKRALLAVTDVWFITVHANPDNSTDIHVLEEALFAWDYDAFQRFAEERNV